MPAVLLFGATGYTGRLTAHALARRNISFAIVGRDRGRLEKLAAETGNPDIRIASVGDVAGLVKALEDVKVLITCVGPFMDMGETAIQAALEAGVHYIDSTGEGAFIEDMIDRFDSRAKERGIALAPALGFDEVPSDLAATLATEGLARTDLTLTYAMPSTPSVGTARTLLGIISRPGRWIVDDQPVDVHLAEKQRWAPMPPPLGPKQSMSVPVAELVLAPRHLDVRSLRAFGTIDGIQRFARPAMPLVRAALGRPGARRLLDNALTRLARQDGPNETQRAARWTVLAEALSDDGWRNVAVQGRDAYGLTAELLATGAAAMTEYGYDRSGVLAPCQAVDVDVWKKTLHESNATIHVFEPVH